MRIERMGPADVSRVVGAGRSAFDHEPRPEWTAMFLEDDDNVLLMALGDDGAALGMLSGTRLTHPDKAPEFHVRELGVVTTRRRQGIATALVRAAIALAPELGCSDVWLVTEAENTAACGLYERLDGEREDGAVIWSWSAAGADVSVT